MRRFTKAAATACGLALAGTALTAAPAHAGGNLGGAPIPDGATRVNPLTVNDFHGRIDGGKLDGVLGKSFACTVVTQDAALGGAVLVGNGDLIGASAFASAVQKDEPTINFFNPLGMATSSVGNHEFDAGFKDLTDRVMPLAGFSYLGANVVDATTPRSSR